MKSVDCSLPSRLLDYAIPPTFLACALAATHVALEHGVPHSLVGLWACGPLAIAAAILERVRPERPEFRQLDQPFVVEAAHFLFPYQLGYALALSACAGVAYLRNTLGIPAWWPTYWAQGLQILCACVLGETSAYWQHRLAHRARWLWRFHALHHSGERLNLSRAGRFHFVDLGTGAFMLYLPLVLLGAPDAVVAWVVSINGVLGILEHANMRVRTPKLVSWLVCTPAAHRLHHARSAAESNRNFGTATMLVDVLFGTYQAPRADGPLLVGIEEDPVPRGFWNQVLSPFSHG